MNSKTGPRGSGLSLLTLTIVIVLLLICQSQQLTSDERFFKIGGISPHDKDLVQLLLPHIPRNLTQPRCATDKQLPIDSKYVNSIVNVEMAEGGASIVTPPRNRATAYFTRVALTLPEGDIVETGVYIGTSAAIIMRVMKDYDFCQRKLWVFDSFEGLPVPTREDKGQGVPGRFNVTVDMFKRNLIGAGVYDDNRIVITKGWFSDTCARSKVEKIAYLRLDGDLFASTWDAITALYARVVPGGIIYVDDYATYLGCRDAIDTFRTQHGIYEPLRFVKENEHRRKRMEFEAVWWVKRK